ncbi:hypothetical protein QO004_000458 [Rhizobium mesoamericanum]|uniref:hypothetical protein n=1 Tax=Rhizobium mesoamericanum TaxID=1079800 RepID=UPI002783F5D3|nr:hypothetical protein [Rhizobium mesoamericanum]MDQ0558683.1 hypothetical protein [Rhizobium mesoamericanum]
MGYLFGGDTGQTQNDVSDARKRLALAMLQQGTDTSPIQSPWQGAARMAQALMGGLEVRQAREDQQAADAQVMSLLTGQPYTPPEQSGNFLSGLFGHSKVPASGAQHEIAASNPAPADVSGLSSNQVYNDFINTVKSGYEGVPGVTNPYGLAAVAATGRAESGFSPGNVNRTWSDPSQSGQPGTAGGIMSWRGPRYAALAATGDLSPAGQAKFFLQENPQLITALNNAKSVEEAQRLMNNAWAFAGHDQPGGESARRLSYAQGFLPTFGTQVASAAPAPEMAAASAPALTPYRDPQVTTAYPQPQATPAEQAIGQQAPLAQSQDPVQVASIDPKAGGMPVAPQQPQPQVLPPLPSSTVAPPPAVASVAPVSAPANPSQAAATPAPGTVRLAQALDATAPQGNPLANNPRAQALVKAMMNPNASPQVRALAGSMLQQDMARNQDLYKLQLEQALKQQDPVYQANLKKAQYEADHLGQVSPDTAATLQAQANKPLDINGHLVSNDGREIADFSTPVKVEPGESLFKGDKIILQGAGYKPSDVTDLRKEIQGLPTYKSYQQALPSYQSMIDTAKTDSKASDLNLVYGLGKIMDPNSVVREGEMVMVNNTSSLPDWLQGAINSVNGGSRLEPATRKAILNEARSRMTAYRGALDNDLGQYRGIVGRKGMNEADVLPVLGDVADVPDLTGDQNAGPPPEGVPADVWGAMTPAERKLWQK